MIAAVAAVVAHLMPGRKDQPPPGLRYFIRKPAGR